MDVSQYLDYTYGTDQFGNRVITQVSPKTDAPPEAIATVQKINASMGNTGPIDPGSMGQYTNVNPQQLVSQGWLPAGSMSSAAAGTSAPGGTSTTTPASPGLNALVNAAPTPTPTPAPVQSTTSAAPGPVPQAAGSNVPAQTNTQPLPAVAPAATVTAPGLNALVNPGPATNVAPAATVTAPTITNTPATTGTGGAATSSNTAPTGWNQQAFLTAHPNVMAEWNNPQSGYQSFYGSLENYLHDAIPANGSPQEVAAYQTASGGAGATTGTTANGSTVTPATVAGGGNYNQNQAANQAGAFNTNTSTAANSAQTSGQATNTAQTGVQNTTGTNQQSTTNAQNQTTGGTTATNQTQTGQTNTAGVSTTGVNDTLGLGALLKSAAPQAQANDTTRNAFLTDVVNTGGSQFGSQVDQAVRNSLTGPQMTGTGDSARARAAGYAGAEVGRTNLGNRLNAASQLAGPSSLTSLVSAGNPYLGSSTSTTGSQNTLGSLTGSQIQTGFNNLVGTSNTAGANTQNTSSAQNTASSQAGYQNTAQQQNANESGTASGASSQAAAGQIPQAQQVSTGGGGCVVCTAGLHHGVFRHRRILQRVIRYKLQQKWSTYRHAARGYFFLFTPFARWLLSHPRATRTVIPLASAVVYDELRTSGRGVPFKLWPWLLHQFWHFGCKVVGRLPVPDHVTDTTVLEAAKAHNVLFQVGGKTK